MHLRLDMIPEEIILAYNLHDIVNPDGWVYIEIRKGMYVLPQAGILANKLLEQWLSARGYYQCQHTPGLWRHKWRAITFCLVVVNFGIKVTDMANFHHLKTSLKDYYEVAIDWTGLLFCGVKLTWDYKRYHANCSMPGYVDKVPASHANGTPRCTLVTLRLLSNMAPSSSKLISTSLPHCHQRS